MEINTTINLSILISAILAITGWLINDYLKRQHEIAKKRLEYRLETLHSFIPFIKSLDTIAKTGDIPTEFYNHLNNSHLQFQLYGNQHENDIFNELMKSIEDSNIKEINKLSQKLIDIIRIEIRNELKLPKLK